jgi:cytochrome c oxidase subunit 4
MIGSDGRRIVRTVLLEPVIVWVGLCVVLAMTCTYANWPALPLKLPMSLLFAAIKGSLVVVFFMELGKASGITRIAAAAGLLWASFMFLLTFADFLTR